MGEIRNIKWKDSDLIPKPGLGYTQKIGTKQGSLEIKWCVSTENGWQGESRREEGSEEYIEGSMGGRERRLRQIEQSRVLFHET